jgi:hypothetical protein
MRRLRANQVSLRAPDFFFRTTHSGIRARQFGSQFGNFQDREGLTGLYVIADVDVNDLDVAGHLRVNIHILKRLELSGDGQRGADAAPLGVRDGRDAFRRTGRRMAWVASFDPRMSKPTPSQNGRHQKNEDGNPDSFLSHYLCPWQAMEPARVAIPVSRHLQNFRKGLTDGGTATALSGRGNSSF